MTETAEVPRSAAIDAESASLQAPNPPAAGQPAGAPPTGYGQPGRGGHHGDGKHGGEYGERGRRKRGFLGELFD